MNLCMHADAEHGGHPLSAFTWLATANTENPLTRGLKPQTLKRGTMETRPVGKKPSGHDCDEHLGTVLSDESGVITAVVR